MGAQPWRAVRPDGPAVCGLSGGDGRIEIRNNLCRTGCDVMVNDWIILKYDCFLKFLCYNI